MSRVLLFVQTGDARPKCAKSFGDRRHNALNYFEAVRKRLGENGQPTRAWLVECESADLGRMAITTQTEQFGRILASGGRR